MLTLDDLLGEISVGEVDKEMIEVTRVETGKDLSAFLGWYYVLDESAIRGYFKREADALGYRLFLINLRLNYPNSGQVEG